MRTRNLFFVLLVLLALAVSACAPAAAAGTAQPPVRTLSVSGQAQASLEPDIAHISIGVHTENENPTQAVNANNTQSQKVIDALKAQGIDEKDILTTNFNIYPQDEYGPTGEKIRTKFVVDNTVYVTLHDLSKIGEMLGAAVGAGANSVYGITFDVQDKETALAEARKAAVANARAQAEEMAAAAGVTLGPVQNINYYNSYPILYDAKVARGGGADMAASSVPISAGQITLTVDVNIVYEIK